MAYWQVSEAKRRRRRSDRQSPCRGAQIITRRGTERAVVLSVEDYRILASHKPDFKAHLLGGPKVDDFSIERESGPGRTVEP